MLTRSLTPVTWCSRRVHHVFLLASSLAEKNLTTLTILAFGLPIQGLDRAGYFKVPLYYLYSMWSCFVIKLQFSENLGSWFE